MRVIVALAGISVLGHKKRVEFDDGCSVVMYQDDRPSLLYVWRNALLTVEATGLPSLTWSVTLKPVNVGMSASANPMTSKDSQTILRGMNGCSQY